MPDFLDDPDVPTTCPRCGHIAREGFPVVSTDPPLWHCLICGDSFDTQT